MANSHGMHLVAHEPFESAEAAIKKETDIFSDSVIVETTMKRLLVADTDTGKELESLIMELKELLKAYEEGLIVERD